MAQLQTGDEASYEQLVRRYGPRLLTVARRLLGNEQDALDAVQDALTSAFQNIEQFRGESRLSTWLHRITVNAALQKLRAAGNRKKRVIDPLLPTFLEDGRRADARPAWQPRPDELLEQAETRQLVRDKIDQLPDDHRIVLILRDIEQVSTADTAQLLQLTSATVKTRLHRARQALRTLLEAKLV